MQTSLERANVYRLRAEEMRAIADALSEPEAQDVLLQIADDYDRMAEKVMNIWVEPTGADDLLRSFN